MTNNQQLAAITAEEREAMANRCRKHIEWLSKFAFNRYNHRASVQEELNIYQIALASLSAKPKAWFTGDAENDRSATTYDAAMAERWRNKPWFVGELYEAPPVPVMHPDKLRMDWLCAHSVEVRKPLMYGSHAMFHAQQDSEEWDLPHHTTLREQIDEAIRAAGGSVKE